jgi:hypothetical protein
MQVTALKNNNKLKGRSRISNGRSMFPRTLDGQSIDARGQWSRRVRDLIASFTTDAGGDDTISEGLRSIIRRVALLQSQMERIESVWAIANGEASDGSLETYMRMANTHRRLVEAAGLKTRRMKTVPSLTEYIGRRRDHVIDHNDEDDD